MRTPVKGLILKSSVVILVQFAQVLSSWPLLLKWGMKGDEDFGDLTLTLNQIDCELNRSECNFSQLSSPYSYGRILILVMGLLPSIQNYAYIIGWLIIITTTIFFIFLLSKDNSRTSFVMILLILVSPPYQLLMERMNIDVLILAVVLVATSLYSKGRHLESILLFTFTTLVKFYTLAVFFLFLFAFKGTQRILFIGFFVLISIITFQQFIAVSSSVPNVGGGAFGLRVFIFWLSKSPNTFTSMSIILCVACILILTIKGQFKMSNPIKSLVEKYSLQMFDVFTIICLCNYLLGVNWDYRLVFFAIPFYLLLTNRTCVSRKLKRVILSLFMGVNYLSYNTPGVFQFLGEITIMVSLTVFIVMGLRSTTERLRKPEL